MRRATTCGRTGARPRTCYTTAPHALATCSSPFFLMIRPPPTSPLFPYTTLFRSAAGGVARDRAFGDRQRGSTAVEDAAAEILRASAATQLAVVNCQARYVDRFRSANFKHSEIRCAACHRTLH